MIGPQGPPPRTSAQTIAVDSSTGSVASSSSGSSNLGGGAAKAVTSWWEGFSENMYFRRIGIGAFIGGITGITVGIVDGVRVANLSTDNIAKLGKQLASKPVQRLLVRQQLLCIGCFAAFYGVYQGTTYALYKFKPDMDTYARLGGAGVVAAAPMLPSRVMRRNLPFCAHDCRIGYVARRLRWKVNAFSRALWF